MRLSIALSAMLMAAGFAGCGSNDAAAPTRGKSASARAPTDRSPSPPPQTRGDDGHPQPDTPGQERTAASPSDVATARGAAQSPQAPDDPGDVPASAFPRFAPPPDYDDAQLAAQGIHRVSSRRLVLYSDLPVEKLAGLGDTVDQLFDEWVAYFFLDGAAAHDDARKAAIGQALDGWQVTGYLMADAELFARLGLFPADVGPFPNARSRVIVRPDVQAPSGRRVSRIEFWMHDQKKDYYRRHLLLHEATHCFVDSVVGKPDAPWYAEGIAELFATHLSSEANVRPGGAAQPRWVFRAMPADNDQVPGWGRIPLIQEAVRQGRALTAAQVRQAPAHEFLETQWYAWCWAFATFLDNHPRYRERFRRLPHRRRDRALDEAFAELFGDDDLELEEEWQVFVTNLEYGYDVEHTALDLREGTTLAAGESRDVDVAADRGWQNTGVRLEPGRRYHLTARGRYSLSEQPKTWWCEPQGISFRYYQGKPLGRLVAALRAPGAFQQRATSTLLEVLDVGADAVLEPHQAGTLFLRVNDAWGELRDNRGRLTVTVESAQ